MNAQQALVGIYLALEKSGARNLVERSRNAARAAKIEFSNAQASAWLSEFTSRRNPARSALRKSSGREKRAQTDEIRTGSGTRNGLTRDKEPLVSNKESAHALSAHASPRVRVSAPEVLTFFDAEEPDVLAVLANDAGQRRDGLIAESVLLKLRERMGRALAKHGIEAFRHGLQVAIDRGCGAAYAVGVMRRYQPGEDAANLLPFKRRSGRDEPYDPFDQSKWPEGAENADGIRVLWVADRDKRAGGAG